MRGGCKTQRTARSPPFRPRRLLPCRLHPARWPHRGSECHHRRPRNKLFAGFGHNNIPTRDFLADLRRFYRRTLENFPLRSEFSSSPGGPPTAGATTGAGLQQGPAPRRSRSLWRPEAQRALPAPPRPAPLAARRPRGLESRGPATAAAMPPRNSSPISFQVHVTRRRCTTSYVGFKKRSDLDARGALTDSAPAGRLLHWQARRIWWRPCWLC